MGIPESPGEPADPETDGKEYDLKEMMELLKDIKDRLVTYASDYKERENAKDR